MLYKGLLCNFELIKVCGVDMLIYVKNSRGKEGVYFNWFENWLCF